MASKKKLKKEPLVTLQFTMDQYSRLKMIIEREERTRERMREKREAERGEEKSNRKRQYVPKFELPLPIEVS